MKYKKYYWAGLFIFLISAVIVVVVFLQKRGKNQKKGQVPIDSQLQSAVCISLPYRKDKYKMVKDSFHKQGIQIEWSPGIVGKHMLPAELPNGFVTDRVRGHWSKNPQHLGHLGATLGHQKTWRDIVDFYHGVTFIGEDDVLIDKYFKNLLNERLLELNQYDPDWDILLLGFSCSYDSYDKCHKNDPFKEPIGKGLVKVGYFIGLWGYVINGKKSAEKILQNVFPYDWMVDHHLNLLIEKQVIQVYGCVPNIAMHPGSYGCSSWNYMTHNRADRYFSDTNN